MSIANLKYIVLAAALGLGACGVGSSSTGSSNVSCVPDPGSTVVCVSEPAATDSQHAYQGVKARVGFYPNDQCTPGTEVMVLQYDLSQTCFGWRRSAGNGTRDNSATHFECYRDRVCYTQHTKVMTCSSEHVTDKEYRTDVCIKDDGSDVWLKLLSGTESCPEAPVGFSCPRSNPGDGTPGIS